MVALSGDATAALSLNFCKGAERVKGSVLVTNRRPSEFFAVE